MMPDLKPLIAELEAVTEGTRLLDAKITAALDLRPDWASRALAPGILWVDDRDPEYPVVRFARDGFRKSPGNPPIGDYPHFTTTVDAARTLLPAGCIWEVGAKPLGTTPPVPYAALSIVIGSDAVGNAKYADEICVVAATPALALAAVALKPRGAG